VGALLTTIKHSMIPHKRANLGEVVDCTLLDGDAYAVAPVVPFELGPDDEVEIVDGPPTSPKVYFPFDHDDDASVAIVGVALKHHTAHTREACSIYVYPKNECAFLPPSPSKVKHSEALKHCDMCHCFICGCLASECTKWEQHCTAHPKCKQSWSAQYDHQKQAEKAAAVVQATGVDGKMPAKARGGIRAKKQRTA
jgi:hypothetical protein